MSERRESAVLGMPIHDDSKPHAHSIKAQLEKELRDYQVLNEELREVEEHVSRVRQSIVSAQGKINALELQLVKLE